MKILEGIARLFLVVCLAVAAIIFLPFALLTGRRV